MPVANSKPYTRARDMAYLARRIEDNDCCAIVGVSNIGKSGLLRQLRRPDFFSYLSPKIQSHELGFIYIDFNLQLQMTGQGFYELVLRTILAELKGLQPPPAIVNEVEAAYRQVIAPTDEFQNALNFNQAIITLCEKWSRRLVLLFDEFDEVYQGLDARVFLNLRALRDKYADRLMYIVVVGASLPTTRHDPELSEFAELFTHHTYFLQPLEKGDVEKAIKRFAEANQVQFSAQDIALIAAQSGGHPGLLETTCQVLAHNTVAGVAPDPRIILNHLSDNPNIRIECVKLWNSLSPEKQEALLTFYKNGAVAPVMQQTLIKNGLLTVGEGGRMNIFGQLFEDFVRRQQLIHDEPKQGLVIDIEAGQVYVDGKETASLTNLEYRLLLLLYGHIDKICDKYRIVEAVWGEDYIEEVDDARIEKLVSRLRQKIEPNPSAPQHLMTIRGRGYRLQS
ncbi:MAG: winged helix-turn-helix domain-containing protein [Anaerolineae bacterium]